jgi:hypothetical protein
LLKLCCHSARQQTASIDPVVVKDFNEVGDPEGPLRATTSHSKPLLRQVRSAAYSSRKRARNLALRRLPSRAYLTENSYSY